MLSLHTSQVAHQTGTYLRFLQYEVTRNILLPLGGMLVHIWITPQH